MFRRLFGFGLFILLLMALFGGLSSRSRAAYYEGYEAGLQAQASESVEEGAETAVPPAAPYHDGYGHGRFFGWGALGILGIFAIFFKIGFFFLLAMLFMRLVFGRRWKHRGGKWGHGPWGHHHKHSHHPGHEKSPKWMNDDDDDEPVMTV
ncbi:MAG: hypothetical protein DHS20C20_22320 [Ardenticatenaceae bacterium]|nr:MAG: hypothetical protein DHS20C20_22320 [Ardenticatenaceae bacterium]